MEETSASPAVDRTGWPKILIPAAAIALVLVLAAVFAYQIWSARQTGVAPAGSESLSAAELEARYGLRVRLIGVTAGGGLIDFRLKIVDADKAEEFLQDPANLPRLIVAESGTALMAPEGIEDNVEWENDGILFVLYTNNDGVIKTGTPVIVEFGNVQLEPVPAQ